MSAEFESKVVILSLLNISCLISSSSSSTTTRSKSCLAALHFCVKQRLVLESPSLSMRLRPKRYHLFFFFFHFSSSLRDLRG